MNIVRGLRQLGRLEEARALVRRLQAMPWPPLAAALSQLEAEIANAAQPNGDGSVPEVGASKPAPMRMRVDLPAPLGPSSPNMPGVTSRLSP